VSTVSLPRTSDPMVGNAAHTEPSDLSRSLGFIRDAMPDVRRARGSGGSEAEVVARSVEGYAELTRVAADLGEEEAALDACHGGGGERGGVGVFAQLAAHWWR